MATFNYYIFSVYSTAIITLLVVSNCQGYTDWNEYRTAYEQQPYFPRLYPYTEEFHDTKVQGGSGFDAGIDYQIPYYGRLYSSAYISVDGHIELTRERPALPSSKGPATKWPNDEYPEIPDPPLLSAYYSSWHLEQSDPDGNIFWRRLDPREDNTDIAESLLSLLSLEVREHVVGGDTFQALYGLLVTWDNMYFASCPHGPKLNCPRNTVQIALLTDEVRTYVMYNYYNLTWIGSIEQGCDPITGLRGAEPFHECFPAQEGSQLALGCFIEVDGIEVKTVASIYLNSSMCTINGSMGTTPSGMHTMGTYNVQAGFNMGEARNFIELPDSNTDAVVHLDLGGSTGVTGRYIYDMTHIKPTRGGCTNDTEPDADKWQLEIYPKSISMYGGDEVYFSGPCLLPSHQIMCRFGYNRVVPGVALPDTHSKGMCIAPPFLWSGWTDFCVSTDGGNNYQHCTSIHIVPQYYLWPRIHLYNEHGEWYSTDPAHLLLSWDPASMVHFHQLLGYADDEETNANGTSPEDILVDIKLVGYSEVANVNGTMVGVWHSLHTFEYGVPNTGEYSFNTAAHECTVDCDYDKPIVGILEVSISSEDPELHTKSIYSEAVPLGWYLNTAFTQTHGEDWAKIVCIDWSARERSDTAWISELEPCPMTRGQAFMDIGGFIYPNPDCDPGEPCPMKPRPDHHIECAEGMSYGSLPHGSVSTCCYPRGTTESLTYGLDGPQGSAAHRASPYAERSSGHVHVTPYLSHWTRDRLPYVLCCNWTGSEEVCIEQYMQVRPTLSTDLYNPPKYAIAYGDPHFFTFDGTEFMFNGHGEFWLLMVDGMEAQYDNFNLQARLLTPPIQPGGAVNATVMVALAMQEGPSQDQEVPKIEVQLNAPDATTRLLVLVNGVIQDFSETGLMYQQFYSNPFNGVRRRTIIQNNDPISANHVTNVTIIFENGIAVQVENRNGFLHAIVAVPHKYKHQTKGLFGLWNDDPSDDLKSSAGVVIDSGSSTEEIHYNFGQTWEIISTDSRFTYRGKANWDYFSDRNFVPNFEEPVGSQGNITEDEVDDFCEQNVVCRFDYKTTMSRTVANSSVFYQLWTFELKNTTSPVVSCPYLEIPRSYRTVDTYIAGGQLTLTGCFEGYTLLGETHYTCTQINEYEAAWSPYVNAECKSDDEIAQEKSQLLAAILTPLCLLAVVAVVGTGGFIYYRKRKAVSESGESGGGGGPPASKAVKAKPVTELKNRSDQFEAMAENASRSQSLASMNVSFGSVVLTEQLTTARPQRPQSGQPAGQAAGNTPQRPQSGHRVGQAAGNTHNTSAGSRQGSVLDLRLQPDPYANRSAQNTSMRGSNQNVAEMQPGYGQYGVYGSQNQLASGYANRPTGLNTSRGSQGGVGFNIPPPPPGNIRGGQINRSFDHKPVPQPPLPPPGGVANVAMAEESDYEPKTNAVHASHTSLRDSNVNTFV